MVFQSSNLKLWRSTLLSSRAPIHNDKWLSKNIFSVSEDDGELAVGPHNPLLSKKDKRSILNNNSFDHNLKHI